MIAHGVLGGLQNTDIVDTLRRMKADGATLKELIQHIQAVTIKERRGIPASRRMARELLIEWGIFTPSPKTGRRSGNGTDPAQGDGTHPTGKASGTSGLT